MTDINELEHEKKPITKKESEKWFNDFKARSKERAERSNQWRRAVFAELARNAPDLLEKMKKERPEIFHEMD